MDQWEYLVFILMGFVIGYIATLYLKLHQYIGSHVRRYAKIRPLVVSLVVGSICCFSIYGMKQISQNGIATDSLLADAFNDGTIVEMQSFAGLNVFSGLVANFVVRVIITILATNLPLPAGDPPLATSTIQNTSPSLITYPCSQVTPLSATVIIIYPLSPGYHYHYKLPTSTIQNTSPSLTNYPCPQVTPLSASVIIIYSLLIHFLAHRHFFPGVFHRCTPGSLLGVVCAIGNAIQVTPLPSTLYIYPPPRDIYFLISPSPLPLPLLIIISYTSCPHCVSAVSCNGYWFLLFSSGSSRAIYIQGYALIGAVAFGSGITQSISVAVLAIEMTGKPPPLK